MYSEEMIYIFFNFLWNTGLFSTFWCIFIYFKLLCCRSFFGFVIVVFSLHLYLLKAENEFLSTYIIFLIMVGTHEDFRYWRRMYSTSSFRRMAVRIQLSTSVTVVLESQYNLVRCSGKINLKIIYTYFYR